MTKHYLRTMPLCTPALIILSFKWFTSSCKEKSYEPHHEKTCQDQDRLLVKRRNDNHSPGPVIREISP